MWFACCWVRRRRGPGVFRAEGGTAAEPRTGVGWVCPACARVRAPRLRRELWGAACAAGDVGGPPLLHPALWLLRGLSLPVCRCAAWPLFSPVLLPSVSRPTLTGRVGSSRCTVPRTLVTGSSGSAAKLEVWYTRTFPEQCPAYHNLREGLESFRL